MWQNLVYIYDNNCQQNGYRGKVPQDNKSHMWQAHSEHYTQCWKSESFFSKIRDKIMMPILVTFIQHSLGNPKRQTSGILGGSSGKEPTCQYRWLGWEDQSLGWEDPLKEAWQPTPVFLPGEPMDRGAWWATVHGVAKSQTGLKSRIWLKQFSTHAQVTGIREKQQKKSKLEKKWNYHICVCITDSICCAPETNTTF